MGIPRLTKHLRPYAQSTTFAAADDKPSRAQSDDQRARRRAIIDGPALAYFAFYRALALRGTTARHALDAAPSYTEVGSIAVAWLMMLQQHGFDIKAVLFDGALPIEKRATRIARLEGYLSQLKAFRASHAGNLLVASSRPTLTDAAVRDFSSILPGSASIKSLPPPAFMVPAVIEALQASDFSAVTRVVGAEADMFCAYQARLEEAWVFTGDSDLLVHDIHPQSSVVFLQDVQITSGSESGALLSVTYFTPHQISLRLELPCLLPLAYVVHLDPQRGFSECVKLAKQQQASDADYKEFAETYTVYPDHETATRASGDSDRSIGNTLHNLDPRLSELVFQWLTDTSRSETTEYEVYLPFLIDDPSRASAWQACRWLRRLAYRLLNDLFTSDSTGNQIPIIEHERRGPRIAPTHCLPMNSSEIFQTTDTLASSLAQWTPSEPNVAKATHWRSLATSLLLGPLAAEGKPLPPPPDISNLLCNLDTGTNWAFTHLHAQMQACLYSLRMLQQVLRIVETSTSLSSIEVFGDIAASVDTLRQSTITQLPGLRQLFPSTPISRTEVGERKAAVRELVARLVEGFEVPKVESEGEVEEVSVKKGKRRRVKRARSMEDESAVSKFASRNGFSLLSDE